MRQHGKSAEQRAREQGTPNYQADFERAASQNDALEIPNFRVSEARASRHASPLPPILHNRVFIKKVRAMEFRIHRLEESVQIESDAAEEKRRRARVTETGDFGSPIDATAVNMRPISDEALTDYSRKRFDRLSLKLARGEE